MIFSANHIMLDRTLLKMRNRTLLKMRQLDTEYRKTLHDIQEYPMLLLSSIYSIPYTVTPEERCH